jgi:RecA/RadA recombinase
MDQISSELTIVVIDLPYKVIKLSMLNNKKKQQQQHLQARAHTHMRTHTRAAHTHNGTLAQIYVHKHVCLYEKGE